MNEYVEYLREVFEVFGPVTVRRMFGGYGIYYNGLMFALVADDTLYLKADDENSGYFEKEGLDQFAYGKKGKTVKLSYYRAPDEILDDREEAVIWARRSFEAALRFHSSKSKRKRNE